MSKYSKDYSKVFEAIQKKTTFSNGSSQSKDSRIYVPKLGEDQKAIATFRFLDAPSDDLPFVIKRYHYWDKKEILCPRTFGGECPICKFNIPYNVSKEKDYIRSLGTVQQSCYYINIAVISDKNTPENVGKNFIFKFGNPIYKKLEEVLNDGFIPWDEDSGINFKLEVIKVDNQNNYANSRFVANDESDSIENKYIESSLLKSFKDSKEVVASIKKGVFDLSSLVKKEDLLSEKELKDMLNERIEACDEYGKPKTAGSKAKSQAQVQDKPKKTMVDDETSAFDDDDDFPPPKK